MEIKRIETDFLVIGSGLAALNFTLRICSMGDVLILTKKRRTDANTNYAQGGVASVFDDNDSISSHKEDTIRAGFGLSDERTVDIMVREGPVLIEELNKWGVNFNKDKNSTLELWKEGGHSYKRIVHAGDFTGREIEKVLISSIKSHQNIRIFEHHLAYEFIINDNICYGVYALDVSTGEIIQVIAKLTFLGTGGACQVYRYTSNPSVATGDGIAMAYNAGCRVADLEFVQFHPTTLYTPEEKERQFLISEALRGAGAILLDRDGNRFMEGIHPKMELAPRDIVAQACDDVLKGRGDEYVYLDISHKDEEEIRSKFPNIYNECLKQSYNMTREPIPVVPAAHYLCGGVVIDTYGRTDVKGLLAAGEVAFTGVHGANRLASNSLLEVLVFSTRASNIASEWIIDHHRIKDIELNYGRRTTIEESILAVHTRKEIKHTMWDYVGIARRDYLLNRALRRFEMYKEEIEELYRNSYLSQDIIELRSLITIAYLITVSALSRRETRGLHYNKDHPEMKDEFKKHTILKKEE